MLELQDNINKIVADQWRDKRYPWYRAAWIECGELVEHYGFKWWKKQTPDMPQVVLEVVDIWHFVLSMYLADNKLSSYEEIADAMLEEMDDIYSPHGFGVIEAAEFLAEELLRDNRCSIATFWHLLSAAEMTPEGLYTKYICKNVLNKFRQANGYKEGTYIKNWNGREDNEVLFDIMRESINQDDISNFLYKKLELEYSRVCVQ